jgi:hypothetical protein
MYMYNSQVLKRQKAKKRGGNDWITRAADAIMLWSRVELRNSRQASDKTDGCEKNSKGVIMVARTPEYYLFILNTTLHGLSIFVPYQSHC